MKLSILNEYETAPKLTISDLDINAAFHKFIDVVASYFKTGKATWDTFRIPVEFDGKTISITIRNGVNAGSYDKPKMAIEASWDDTIEVRLDVPKNYAVDWEQQKVSIVGVISVNYGHQIHDAVTQAANGIIKKMLRTGRVTDYP